MELHERQYKPAPIEAKWQAVWSEESTWQVPNPGQPGFDPERPKAYVLEMLPYPSGEPHVGHLKNYSIGDAIAHFRRRHGLEVIHPMGYDAFGLPAENHAIRTGEHPRDSTEASIASFREQFLSWGISIDWSRELATHTPEYYRWTQWLFLRLLEQGLAYREEAAVHWCPKDATVLANEQVIDGRCERCGTLVEPRRLRQWFFRITDYADRLLSDFDLLESWPENVVTMQRNWIGRSEGAEAVFRCADLDLDFTVFTTRPDTLFGATFFVLAPEHPDLERLIAGTENEAEVREYVAEAMRSSATERGDEARAKSGIRLGRTVTNPVNGEEIPVFVADYVLMEYGTGAIMAVPAHDERDFEFARKYGLDVRRVVAPADADPDDLPEGEVMEEAYVDQGPDDVLVNSGEFDGLTPAEAKERIIDWLGERGVASKAVNYRLRDWLVSRQRYWGCPIPVVHCPDCGIVAVPDEQLPVELPEISDYKPKGQSPLETATDWVETTLPRVRRAGAARDRHDGHLRRFLVVLPALPRSAQHGAAVRPGDRRPLDGRRPVHRRRRARDPPPDVCPLLRQGARGRRPPGSAGAVHQPLHPGNDHPGRGEDVQVEGQRRQPARACRPARCGHGAYLRLFHGPARARWRLGRRRRRGRAPFPRSPLAPRRRGRGAHRGAEPGCPTRCRATPERCSSRRIGRSTRRPATSSAASSSTR